MQCGSSYLDPKFISTKCFMQPNGSLIKRLTSLEFGLVTQGVLKEQLHPCPSVSCIGAPDLGKWPELFSPPAPAGGYPASTGGSPNSGLAWGLQGAEHSPGQAGAGMQAVFQAGAGMQAVSRLEQGRRLFSRLERGLFPRLPQRPPWLTTK